MDHCLEQDPCQRFNEKLLIFASLYLKEVKRIFGQMYLGRDVIKKGIYEMGVFSIREGHFIDKWNNLKEV